MFDHRRRAGRPEHVAAPAVLRLDNGPEIIAAALAQWAGTKTSRHETGGVTRLLLRVVSLGEKIWRRT